MPVLLCVCVFSVLIYPGFVNTWDLAVTVEGQIELFQKNGSRDGIVSQHFTDLTALTYDAVYQSLYFADTQHQNATIFKYHNNKEVEYLVSRNTGDNVQGIAFDPMSRLLFWTDGSNKSILWTSLAPGSEGKSNILIKLDDQVPQGIAVDVCRGIIYWTNVNFQTPSIERATVEGAYREVIVKDDLFMPVGITIDQGSKRIFWADDKEGIYFRLESANLNGSGRKIIYHGTNHQPYNLVVTEDAIYWTDWIYKSVWQLPLERSNETRPTIFRSFVDKSPMGIVSRVNLLDQIKDIQECNTLKDLILNRTEFLENEKMQHDTSVASNLSTDVDYCLNRGTPEVHGDGIKVCSCDRGYSGLRCEVARCHNFCYNGTCYLNSEGLPKCRCAKGFVGERCQESVCEGFCINNGRCNVNAEGEPACRCPSTFVGKRCEQTVVPVLNIMDTLDSVQIGQTSCRCPGVFSRLEFNTDISNKSTFVPFGITLSETEYQHLTNSSYLENLMMFIRKSLKETQDTNDTVSNDVPFAKNIKNNTTPVNDAIEEKYIGQKDTDISGDFDNSSFIHMNLEKSDILGSSLFCHEPDVKTIIILVLGFTTFVFSITIILLLIKIRLLKKRPRIRKRIIVNKNVTPLTSRPEPPQCEITIENCCNMNICETPCFEPGGIRHQMHDADKKEEKKNLLKNMEHPDEMY